MEHSILKNYLRINACPIVVRKRKNYLTYEGVEDRYVYILKEGIIKTSVITREGREFNLSYLNTFGIVTLFRDEYSSYVDAPFNVRVESKQAKLYQVDRNQFWKDVNQSVELQNYVKEYYRANLLFTMKKMQRMLMNGKFGAVCTQVNELYELFGVPFENSQLIDFEVTNEEIARFCGISSASSVNRMIQKLKEDGLIEMIGRKILVKDIEAIRQNIPT